MSATTDSIKQDVRKRPEEIEREADEARSDIERTLEALERQLSPGELLDRALSVLKQNGGEFGGNLAAQVRNNPLPTVLAAASVTWLAAASRRPPLRDSDHTGATSSMAERASSAVSSVRGATHSVADGAHGAADRAKGAARSASDATRSATTSVARASRSGAQSAREGYAYLQREQPLVLGALAVAVGAALGALLPRSEAEDEWLGRTSDEARERIKEEGRHRAKEASDAASRAADEVKRKVKAQTSAGSDERRRPQNTRPERSAGS